MTQEDFDAWECRECAGTGIVWWWKAVTHQFGTDDMKLSEECPECGGLGWRGPDAEKAAQAAKEQA